MLSNFASRKEREARRPAEPQPKGELTMKGLIEDEEEEEDENERNNLRSLHFAAAKCKLRKFLVRSQNLCHLPFAICHFWLRLCRAVSFAAFA